MKLLIVDDIIDTGNTIAVAAQALIEAGAAEIRVAATHGLFSDGAKEKLDNAPIEEIVITNSLPVSEDKRPRCAIILDVAPLLGEAILRTHEERSVSALFI